MAAIIVATEVRGSSFTAKITVDALVIDIELSVYVLRIFICGVGHFFKLLLESGKLGWIKLGAMAFYRATAPNLENDETIT